MPQRGAECRWGLPSWITKTAQTAALAVKSLEEEAEKADEADEADEDDAEVDGSLCAYTTLCSFRGEQALVGDHLLANETVEVRPGAVSLVVRFLLLLAKGDQSESLFPFIYASFPKVWEDVPK